MLCSSSPSMTGHVDGDDVDDADGADDADGVDDADGAADAADGG